MCAIFLKIVIPYRNYKRVKEIVEGLEKEGYRPLYIRRDVLFKERRELDPVEVVFLLDMPPYEVRKLRKKISLAIRGTLGFYIMYPLKKNTSS
ncbi:MAG: hypothetical protein J7L11_05370 [Thermoprotei archaeon]|nr:hypothetical protein [Thermoprotei archaeon]